MKQSQLFTKTLKEVPKDETSKNAQLLIRAGYIHKEMAGAYNFLPLGYRVLQNIIQIIREEIVAIGGQEVLLTSLQRKDLWSASERWDDSVIDVWFKTVLANKSEVGLANTHEEPMTDLLKQSIASYKDLPQYVFQFQNKFRNELRARSGITRTREFIMKDLYSFNKDQESLDAFYEEAKAAYHRIFDRLGIGDRTYLTFASGGAFSKYSHEFQTVCDAGEDTIYLHEGKKLAVNDEVYTDEVLADLGLKKEELQEVRAIETGNIFKLGTRFSAALGLNYTDESGQEKPVIMGSYGIGPARAMGTIVELMSDEKGLVWPESIAPFTVHLVEISNGNENVSQKANEVYKWFTKQGVDVLWDDRDVPAGAKFADSDLIGIPHRIVVSAKTGKDVEYKSRTQDTSELLAVEELHAKIKRQ